MGTSTKTVTKSKDSRGIRPNVADYDAAVRDFSWQRVQSSLAGLPAGRGLNIAWEAVGRHVTAGRGNHTAFRFLGPVRSTDVSYAEFDERTSRFASALAQLSVDKGDVVFGLAPRIDALYVAAIGTLKNRSVFCPLFSAFGPEPIETRMAKGDARVLVTTPALFHRKKIAEIRARVPTLEFVLLAGETNGITGDGIYSIDELLRTADPEFKIEPTDPEDAALLHFTSGTTGTPKGVLHVHAAVAHHLHTGRTVLDLHDNDVYWCTADPGWVTGTSYGIIAPLLCGVTSIVDEGEFDATRWYSILAENQVDVWYTAPTAIRMLMKAGPEPVGAWGEYRPRFIGSVGEPLNPESIRWAINTWDRPIHDNWWQSETGGIMIANLACLDIKPGSMGKPVPGVEAAIARRTEEGIVELIDEPGVEGELVLRRGWPSMFRNYLKQPEKYVRCFSGDWYFSGDLAQRDKDGYFHFVGRADDMIKSAGHFIGPFEVESALMEHPSVLEAAVIGKPDATVGNIVKAFVVLKPEACESSKEEARIVKKIQGHARKKLGAAVAPKEIEITDHLPHTRSGKILRRLLRARELGLPEGDTSTLETAETE